MMQVQDIFDPIAWLGAFVVGISTIVLLWITMVVVVIRPLFLWARTKIRNRNPMHTDPEFDKQMERWLNEVE